MATPVENFSATPKYSGIVQKISDTLAGIDLENTDRDVFDKNLSIQKVIKYDTEENAKAIGDIVQYLKQWSHRPNEEIDQTGLVAPVAGEKVTVQARIDFLDKIAKRRYYTARELQKIEEEEELEIGKYYDPKRETIVEIPESISNGQTDTISDSALKLIGTFQGDTDSEAEKLKIFLHAVFDVAVTNDLNEKTVIKVLKRKLENTARKLIKRFETKFANNGQDPPNLRQIVIKLEDRFCTEFQPEVAAARLSVYTKSPNQSYQALEADICELTELAARAEEAENRPQWISNKEITVFKQAVSETDRRLIYRENLSRKSSRIPEMTMEEMVDYLTKTYSDQKASSTASNLKTQQKIGDSDSIQTITEKKSRKQRRLEAQLKKMEDNKFGNGNFGNGNRGRGNYRGNQRNNNQQSWRGNTSSYNNGNQNGHRNGFKNGFGNKFSNQNKFGRNNQNGNTTKPRKFVTPEMVNVDPHSCLKCNSPSHRFTETEKCIYGKSNLFTKPCFSCGKGGHHYNMCVQGQKPTLGAPPPKGPQEPLDKKFSTYPDWNKNIPERPDWETSIPKEKNEQMPPLFQW